MFLIASAAGNAGDIEETPGPRALASCEVEVAKFRYAFQNVTWVTED